MPDAQRRTYYCPVEVTLDLIPSHAFCDWGTAHARKAGIEISKPPTSTARAERVD